MSFIATLGKTKWRLSAFGLVCWRIKRRRTNLRILPQREKARSWCIHRRSEKIPASLPELLEGFSLLKAVSKVQRRWLLLQMWGQQCKTSRNMKNPGNMTTSKDHNSLPVLDPKKHGDLWFIQQRLQISCFKEAQWATRYGDICIRIADSPCCTVETNTTL